LTVTVAPLTAAPEASSTLPEIAADTWAPALAHANSATTATNRAANHGPQPRNPLILLYFLSFFISHLSLFPIFLYFLSGAELLQDNQFKISQRKWPSTTRLFYPAAS
jgi:hypothetical protein